MLDTRASGILLHPTSLPGRGGIGELGSAAFRFVDWLHTAGQQLWQILPLGPTGYGDSPYQSFSAFAGNPLLISIEALYDAGLVDARTFLDVPTGDDSRVNYGTVIGWKNLVFHQAFERFQAKPSELRTEWENFCRAEAAWLDDYALFRAIKSSQGEAAWTDWQPELALREPAALQKAQEELSDTINFHRFLQFLFFRQWRAVKAYANERNIRIIGDVPIFVAFDSADVWAHRDIFQLDEQGKPIVIAGVPPDYFSATGQLWGNPHYRWDVLAAQGYRWWIDRVRATLATVDIIRIDHFRGFEAAWAVPGGASTAAGGTWVAGPGSAVFQAIHKALGNLPFIAEDLGVITPPVEAIRDELGLPGMKVLQFAWGDDAQNPYRPHSYHDNCVVYTGTHDNDTTVGWFATLPDGERQIVQTYIGADGHDIAWDFIRLAFTSVANTAIVPLQDVLSLGTDSRMNIPGHAGGNWGWRYREELLTDQRAAALQRLTAVTGRLFGDKPTKPQ